MYLFYNWKTEPLWCVVWEMGWEGEGTGIVELVQRETEKTTTAEGASEENGKSFIHISKLRRQTEPNQHLGDHKSPLTAKEHILSKNNFSEAFMFEFLLRSLWCGGLHTNN